MPPRPAACWSSAERLASPSHLLALCSSSHASAVAETPRIRRKTTKDRAALEQMHFSGPPSACTHQVRSARLRQLLLGVGRCTSTPRARPGAPAARPPALTPSRRARRLLRRPARPTAPSLPARTLEAAPGPAVAAQPTPAAPPRPAALPPRTAKGCAARPGSRQRASSRAEAAAAALTTSPPAAMMMSRRPPPPHPGWTASPGRREGVVPAAQRRLLHAVPPRPGAGAPAIGAACASLRRHSTASNAGARIVPPSSPHCQGATARPAHRECYAPGRELGSYGASLAGGAVCAWLLAEAAAA